MLCLGDSCAAEVLDFISVVWGDLSNVKWLGELAYGSSCTILFVLITAGL